MPRPFVLDHELGCAADRPRKRSVHGVRIPGVGDEFGYGGHGALVDLNSQGIHDPTVEGQIERLLGHRFGRGLVSLTVRHLTVFRGREGDMPPP